MVYYTYILRCKDGSFYCGCTNNLEKRVHQHNHAKAGARYTKTRRPVVLIYFEKFKSLAKSRAREAAIKRLTRKQKEKLVKLIK